MLPFSILRTTHSSFIPSPTKCVSWKNNASIPLTSNLSISSLHFCLSFSPITFMLPTLNKFPVIFLNFLPSLCRVCLYFASPPKRLMCRTSSCSYIYLENLQKVKQNKGLNILKKCAKLSKKKKSGNSVSAHPDCCTLLLMKRSNMATTRRLVGF